MQAGNTTQFVQLLTGTDETKRGEATAKHCFVTGLKRYGAPVVNHSPVDVLLTVKNYLITDKAELKYKNLRSKSEICAIFLIDSSASMVKDKQISIIKGLVQQTIKTHMYRKITYAAVALNHGEAKIMLPPTLNALALIDHVRRLYTGGKTNMKQGFQLIKQLIKSKAQENKVCFLYIFTDGKINAGETESPFEEAVSFFKTHLKFLRETTVVDTEKGFIQLGMARKLAASIQAKYIKYKENSNPNFINN